jgi:hypothetical protein
MKFVEPDVTCQVDEDCWFIVEQNACVNTCPVASSAMAFELFQSSLGDDIQACDANCPPLPTPPCAPVLSSCGSGGCTAVIEGGG